MADILNPEYWRQRVSIANAKGEPHQALFVCPEEKWKAIEKKHKEILAELIQPNDRILDVGCGWGRLLSLLPKNWNGAYVGIDSCQEFLFLAIQNYPANKFLLGDARWLANPECYSIHEQTGVKFSWAVLCGMESMIIGSLGNDEWVKLKTTLHKVAEKLLILDYDENCGPTVEVEAV